MAAITGSDYVMSQYLTFCAIYQRHSIHNTQLVNVDEHIETSVVTGNARVVVNKDGRRVHG